jgi:CPA2 family monovalent cation:H+ antiporter-2
MLAVMAALGLDFDFMNVGAPRTATVAEGSEVCGKQLCEVNLRGRTGAMVLAIQRGEERILMPSAAEVLRVGDLVEIGGSSEAVAAAEEVLTAVAAAAASPRSSPGRLRP